MVFLGELRIEAVLENLRTISDFIHDIGERLQLTKEVLFDIDLAVQEAAANIVNHAYPLGQAGEILVCVETTDDVVHIMLTDWGLPLDPDNVKPFDVHAPIETHIKGGLGLHLIHSLMDAVVRKTAAAPGGSNTLTLSKYIERLQSRGLSAQHSAGTERHADCDASHGAQSLRFQEVHTPRGLLCISKMRVTDTLGK